MPQAALTASQETVSEETVSQETVSHEFERHAAECRAMARTAYDPAYRAGFARLAECLERRAAAISETAWLKFAMATIYSGSERNFFR